MKKMNHTTASGVYPYDHQYGGIGYQVGHEGWSPFPRVNRLREKWGELPWNIDVTRLRLVTESYKSTGRIMEDANGSCIRAFDSKYSSCDLSG